MNRKSFLKGLAIGTISLPVGLRLFLGKNFAQDAGATTLSGQRYEWKMTTTWPPNFPIIGQACQLFADLCKQCSGGRLNIRVFGGGELVPALEAFDTVRSGAAEMGSGAAYYWAGKSPAAQFFATVPFGMNAQQANAWLLHGGGLELWEELYRDFGLIPLPGGNTGVQMGGWFKREINSIADLKGLKMRIPGLGGKVLEKAGGAPVLLAGGEIYTGLERGVIDATEWLGPYHDQLMGFPEIADYYYTPGWHEPGTLLEFFVNKDRFDELPDDLQAIIRTTGTGINQWLFSAMEHANTEALSEIQRSGVQIRQFPEEVLNQLRLHTRQVVEELADTDLFTRKVYDSYRAYQRKAAAYADITEKVFYNTLSKSGELG